MNPLAKLPVTYFDEQFIEEGIFPEEILSETLIEAAQKTTREGSIIIGKSIESLKENSLEACDYSLNKCGEHVLMPMIKYMAQSEENEQGCLKRLDTALFNYFISNGNP